MLGYLFSRVFGNMLGSLYPGYMSYKAVKTRNTKEYVRLDCWNAARLVLSCQHIDASFCHRRCAG